MTRFISHLHSDLRHARTTRRGATKAASEVPLGLHKKYPRMKRIPLPDVTLPDATITEVLRTRRCAEYGEIAFDITFKDYAALFSMTLKQHENTNHRPYPSGGGLYPIETYLLTPVFDSQPGGVFHYNPSEHALEYLWPLKDSAGFRKLLPRAEPLEFSALLVFTSVWDRSSAKYGDYTYPFGLLEAGHMSQNILLAATALGIAARPMAGFNDGALIDNLDVDPDYEQPIHTVTLSKTREKRS